MYFAAQGIISFIAAAAFGVIFNAPRKSLVYCGLVGMVGWLVFSLVRYLNDDPIIASFAGAFSIAFVAHIMAKKFKMPMIIFSVAGIIPLVPGGSAYNAMRNVVEEDYGVAVEYAALALMISGAVAMGLVFAEIITQIWLKSLKSMKVKI
ncbi:threonine/serine exporter family protein [Psychrobacillus sp. Sa2BUA9]|uniref:Threonine/serine exporter family protein n=1 Tax=Psychrobacillus faecigallinarum TaxID=2762235 RepID=A0ABR8R8F8_9BACI|nr:threonine/serine exporter family protein [Psychrobacillus faecigallinarum]MBD7944078.1 threonine/serine exporter family protein [Psychrobacillus faecigallinarum]